MLKKEFLIMQKQDLATSTNRNLKVMLSAFEEILKDYPESTEIDSKKTCEECYKLMEKEARENAVDGGYCFGYEESKTFILNYLGLEEVKDTSTYVTLEDFI